MAGVEAPGAKSDDLSLIPGTQMVGRDDRLPKVVLWSSRMHYGTCEPTHTHK